MSLREESEEWNLRSLAALITCGRDLSQLGEQEQSDLLTILGYHGATHLLHAGNVLPAGLDDKLRQHKKLAAATDTLKQSALKDLLAQLADKDLHNHILFKGTALAHTVYEAPWHRPRTDVDILIDPQDLDAYRQALLSADFESEFAIEGEFVSYQLSFARSLAGNTSIMIDLHWRINNRQCLANAYSFNDLADHAQDLGEELNRAKTPSNVDSLLIACLHRIGHHNREERLAWLYDIHLLSNSLDQSSWQVLVDKASAKNIAALTLDALRLCIELFNTPINKETLGQLKDAASNKELSAILLQRDLAEWRYILADIRALPSWRQRFTWMRESCFPNPTYVKQQMATNNLLLAYSYRFGRGVKRLLGV